MGKIWEYLKNDKTVIILRIIVGILFILSSLPNLFRPDHFLKIIQEYNIISDAIAPLMAVYLPWLEVGCGIMFVFNFYTKSNAVILLLVLFPFTIAVTINICRGLIHDCGCFELFGIKEQIGFIVILRNLILMSFTILIYIKSGNRGFRYFKKLL
ncbi:MAG: MauE/DoxX family redox-associated membrane protein [Candidatus Firestonebacteria bacterium]